MSRRPSFTTTYCALVSQSTVHCSVIALEVGLYREYPCYCYDNYSLIMGKITAPSPSEIPFFLINSYQHCCRPINVELSFLEHSSSVPTHNIALVAQSNISPFFFSQLPTYCALVSRSTVLLSLHNIALVDRIALSLKVGLYRESILSSCSLPPSYLYDSFVHFSFFSMFKNGKQGRIIFLHIVSTLPAIVMTTSL